MLMRRADGERKIGFWGKAVQEGEAWRKKYPAERFLAWGTLLLGREGPSSLKTKEAGSWAVGWGVGRRGKGWGVCVCMGCVGGATTRKEYSRSASYTRD